ncbi:unnamed protein product [Mytilus coruscus]|uniref:Uncharacterized protein n=1 Tax=Mytilus coruscus TaxID=42192 RepID=A0A6J8BI23_MYTCO|nr:unnamed protein product [Mytilus coruscus]
MHVATPIKSEEENTLCVRSEAGEEAKYQDNIDTVTLHHIIEFVVKSFLDDKPLLLPVLANEKFSNSDFLLVTAGGFDNEFKDKGLCSKHGSITEYFDAAGDHEEADTRVWLYAVTSSAINIIIYSPDTDVYFIGLPLLKNINKSSYVQLKDTPYEKSFIDMNALVRSLKNDVCFQGIENIEECIQIVYIFSGCDYTSFFCMLICFIDPNLIYCRD